MKLALVDAAHLAYRCAHVHSTLTHNDQPTGATFGFFKSLLRLVDQFPLYHIVIAWDAGHDRRDKLSEGAKERGIIKRVYKQNRTESQGAEQDLVRWQLSLQWNSIKRGLGHTRFQQVEKTGFEADDIIATLAMKYDCPVTIVSSDHDFYQLLEDSVTIYDPIRNQTIDFATIKEEYGIKCAQQWVDIGALCGDRGDDIQGVPGVGEITAAKLISQHLSLSNLFSYLGLTKAQGKPLSKKELAILEHKEQVLLAFQLKEMDVNVPDLPQLGAWQPTCDQIKLEEFFDSLGFRTLVELSGKFV